MSPPTDRNTRLVFAPGGPLRPTLVLVVEDQAAQQEAVELVLRSRGYGVEIAATGAAGIEMAGLVAPDLVLLDLGLPDVDGLEVLSRLRRFTRCPIIVITGESEDERVVAALDGGADDYLVKPVGAEVLAARVRVSLRHAAAVAALVDDDTLSCGDLTVHVAERRATVGGAEVTFLPKQFDLLVVLLRNEGRLLTQPTLIRTLWGFDAKRDEVYNLRTAVSKIRRILGTGPERPSIVTEPRVGYRLVGPQSSGATSDDA